MRYILSIFLLIFAITATAKPQQSEHQFVGYYETWSEQWVSDPMQSGLVKSSQTPSVIILAFMQPDATYTPGSFQLSGTGIQFPYDGNTFKLVAQKFHETHPNTKLLIAVGGATYTNWDKLNISAIVNVVKDFGLDGVDIDFESYPNCTPNTASGMQCTTDQQLIGIINQLRAALPHPYLLTAAAWSIGAYGADQWKVSQPQGGYTGMYLNPLRQAGTALDMLNVMSYDAGNKTSTGYDPIEAYSAYKHYYHGKIAMGIEVSPEAWGGNVSSLSDVEKLANAVATQPNDGLMLWSLQKRPYGQPSAERPDANMILNSACKILHLAGC